jgi:hypothetical protein
MYILLAFYIMVLLFGLADLSKRKEEGNPD